MTWNKPLHCVAGTTSPPVFHVFVRCCGFDVWVMQKYSEEKGPVVEMHTSGSLPAGRLFKGLHEILKTVDYITADKLHILLRLAELISPMLHSGSASLTELFGKVWTIVLLKQASVLQVQIVCLTSDNYPSPTSAIPPASLLNPSFPNHPHQCSFRYNALPVLCSRSSCPPLTLSLFLSPSLCPFLFLSQPNWSRQAAANPEPGSVQAFYSLRGSFLYQCHQVLAHGGMLGRCKWYCIILVCCCMYWWDKKFHLEEQIYEKAY